MHTDSSQVQLDDFLFLLFIPTVSTHPLEIVVFFYLFFFLKTILIKTIIEHFTLKFPCTIVRIKSCTQILDHQYLIATKLTYRSHNRLQFLELCPSQTKQQQAKPELIVW